LQVLDYAVLVISGADEIFGHTLTLWELLQRYHVPAFIFVNKMDRSEKSKAELIQVLGGALSESCVCFGANEISGQLAEEIAVHSSDENVLEYLLEKGNISDEMIADMIKQRNIFPVYFGSALTGSGIDELLIGLSRFTMMDIRDNAFGGKIYKISRDSKGNRLTHIKITSGSISVKDEIIPGEKIDEIRIYSGEKYTNVTEATAGRIYAITGCDSTYAGQGVGICSDTEMKILEPVLRYELLTPLTVSKRQVYPMLKTLEEELPELKIIWNEDTEEINVMIMGQVQIEILQELIHERFGFSVEFGQGRITYKETINNTVVGVGHFEPLRHYAEVHLLMEPAERGTGISVESECSEDILDKNWQRLIATHINERIHRGVLTGASLTDVRFKIINGRAHTKHTEGGDFRQATYRAIRQGLMQAENILLEPYYSFQLTIPADMVGRAMTDIEQMHGIIDMPDITGDKAVLTGVAPVSTMRDYQINVNAYTHGKGNLTVTFKDYRPCHNQDEVVAESGYNPNEDMRNPSSSVFCAHGSGFIVPWDEVFDYMHVTDDDESDKILEELHTTSKEVFDYNIGADEIEEIMSKTFSANKNARKNAFKKKKSPEYTYTRPSRIGIKREKLLMVDGYNVIFAWDELKALAEVNIDSAKDRLISILSNFKGVVNYRIILVFDGYKVKGNSGSSSTVEDIQVIYTKQDETADRYIEQFTNKNKEKYDITVATSDGLVQQITRGQDCYIISSRELYELIQTEMNILRENYNL
ncbi:MAG: NYN domain-containing protein, partial [Wujia sp.]